MLERRGQQGYVRRCHGDLHLANIVLIEGKPVLFDAIEFDALIASVDVLYDLAFPVVDLLRYERRTAANGLLNRYLGATSIDHIDALAALPLFMSLRAAIRAKVLLARLGRTADDKVAAVKQQARRYFGLAQHLIYPPRPCWSRLADCPEPENPSARALAPTSSRAGGGGAADGRAAKRTVQARGDRLPESAYRPEVTEQVYEMVQRARRNLSQGHSVIVDAVLARESERAGINEVAARLNVRFVGLFLVADLATRSSRVERRQRDASDATPEIVALQETYDIGATDWTVVDASGSSRQTLDDCRTRIALGWAGSGRQQDVAMPPSPKSAAKTASRTGAQAIPRLRSAAELATMACDTAFRIIARRASGGPDCKS